MKMRSIDYGEDMKADIRGEIEMKIVGATDLAVDTAMTAIVARIARRNDPSSAGIGITIAPTVDTMILSRMNRTSAAPRVGGEEGRGIDLDRTRYNQTENIVSVTVCHTTQPDPPYPKC